MTCNDGKNKLNSKCYILRYQLFVIACFIKLNLNCKTTPLSQKTNERSCSVHLSFIVRIKKCIEPGQTDLSWAQVEKLGTRKGNLNLADKDPIITKLHCNFFDGSYEIHYCNLVLEKLHIFSFQVKDALGGIEEKQVEVLYYKKDGKLPYIHIQNKSN